LVEPGAYQLLQEAGREDLWLDFQRVMDDFRRAVSEGDPDTAWMLFFDTYCSHVGPWRALPETTRQAIKEKTTVQLRVYGAQASNPTRMTHIRRLACPTLLIHGQESLEPERVVCELIAANAPLGRIVEVPEAGHMVPLTHGQAVADLLRVHFGQRGA
jgi:pimeloyl-ACP methyl ester carboxylesterase